MSNTDALPDSSAALLQAILESAVDGIITIDPRGRVRSLNRAAESMFGYEASEVVGNNIKMLMPPMYSEHHDGFLKSYMTTGDKKIIGIGREVRGQRKDGSTFPMQLGVSEVCVDDTRIFAGIIEDISERTELQASQTALISQLEAANAELERFSYTVSHDLKSPLITIKGFLGMLEKDAISGNIERLKGDIGRIGRAADKMTLLLDELLELSRIGRVASPSEEVSMSELCNEVVAYLAGPIREADATVVVAPDLPTVIADRVRLSEVVQNLIENALKFRGTAPPKIEIGSRKDSSVPLVFVKDNGVGIESTYTDRVFNLFEQLDNSKNGTGIGLALVKRIIEVHQGKVWVESEGRDYGATFCFTLPHLPIPKAGNAP